jgi:hypothetical protein
VAPACLSRPIEPIDPRTTATFSREVDNNKVDKIDLLLAIDDSGSMEDKQTILAEAVPRLVEALVNPSCVADDPESGLAPVVPAGPTTECPENMHREFDPVLDIHIGIVSSSVGLGGIGVVTTAGVPAGECRSAGGVADRQAHLVSDVLEGEEPVETYQGWDFLAWDPTQKLSPPGEDDLAKLKSDLTRMVRGVGQLGCGFEASLESWYRFLIEPSPAAEMRIDGGKYVGSGEDGDLLAQRARFLRPDSLVAILMLSDENDCSLRPGADVPTDDGALDVVGASPMTNLFCFEQEHLLQPVQRYIDGLTKTQVVDRDGALVDNPLFVAADGQVRSRDRVFLASIVGVPSQLVARDGDIANGLMSADELEGADTWTTLLGDAAAGVLPDAHMIESPSPREGLSRSAASWDPFHGYEHAQGTTGQGELQYSCVFDLPEGDFATCPDCDCKTDKNPLCENHDGTLVQERAKAYPGVRQLQVLRSIGEQGIVASICAKQVTDDTRKDYGYQAAIEALVERLKIKLWPPCLVRSVTPQPSGQVSCVVLEGRRSAGEACTCDGVARSPVAPEHAAAEAAARAQLTTVEADLDCFCEIDQLAGEALQACQFQTEEDVTLPGGEQVSGWCYIDADSFPTVGSEELVEQCPLNQRRIIRTVGEGQLVPGARMFATCQAEN